MTALLTAVETTAIHPGVSRVPFDPVRARRAKKAYTTRFVAEAIDAGSSFEVVSGAEVRPLAGDVVLARVVEVGQHTALQGPTGRRQTLFPGDEIIVAYADRYAPDQFEAFVPAQLSRTNLAAGGGLAADVQIQHALMEDATLLDPIGLLADGEGTLTLRRVAPRQVAPVAQTADGPLVVAVFGTSMNSGKTTTLAHLVHGLARGGLRVHAGKATGTGAWGDAGLFADAGAERVLDFTDFGYASTYRVPFHEVRDLAAALRAELSKGEPDVVVIEVADGIYQDETAQLMADEQFRAGVDSVVFAANGALSAVAGVELLRRHGLPVSAVSGLVTASPLAAREASAVLDVPVVGTFELGEPGVAELVLQLAARRAA